MSVASLGKMSVVTRLHMNRSYQTLRKTPDCCYRRYTASVGKAHALHIDGGTTDLVETVDQAQNNSQATAVGVVDALLACTARYSLETLAVQAVG